MVLSPQGDNIRQRQVSQVDERRKLMKIKNYIWLVVLVIGLTGSQAAGQGAQSKPKPKSKAKPQRLSAAQSAAAVDTSLETTCSQQTPKVTPVLGHDAQVFSDDRVQRTLSGIWRGRVKGNYEKQFLADDGYVNVDYYMIVDAKRGEALVFEQFGSTRAAPAPKEGAPVWSYVSCGRENYRPRHPAQVHEFQKVSDNLEEARAILKTSTGQAFEGTELVLADVWKQLVDTKYFDDPERSLAYAGGFFKFKMTNVPSAEGGSLVDMDMQAEYRGSGQTAAKFERGVPIHGTERGQFLGVQAGSGSFLVSSFGLSREVDVAKEDSSLAAGSLISMTYDKVVLGPLAPTTVALRNNSLRNNSSRNKSKK